MSIHSFFLSTHTRTRTNNFMFIIMSCKADATSLTIEFKIGFLIVFFDMAMNEIGLAVAVVQHNFICIYQTHTRCTESGARYQTWNDQHVDFVYGQHAQLLWKCSISLNYVGKYYISPQNDQITLQTQRQRKNVWLPEIKFEIGLLLVWSDNKYRRLPNHRYATIIATNECAGTKRFFFISANEIAKNHFFIPISSILTGYQIH